MKKLRLSILMVAPMCVLMAAPKLTELEPRGAQRGKAITLTLIGTDLAEGARIISTLPAAFTPLTAPQESGKAGKRLPFLVELKPDAAVGVYPVRVETQEGLSNVLLFTVGALPEGTEDESKPDAREHSNDSIETAQRIDAPAIVNGTLSAADRDYYRIHGKQGERLLFEVEARRSGSAIDPVLRLFDGSGKPVARSEDVPALGVDARLDFTFPREADYYAVIHDARFSGQTQNFYRLKVGNYSYAAGIFPLGGRRGEKVNVEFFGGNQASAARTAVDLSSVDAKANFTRVSVPGEPGSFPFLFAVGDLPEVMKPDSPAAPVSLAPSTVMNGRVSKPGEVDRYKVAVSPGDHWTVELAARALGTSQLDGVITVYDAKGKKLISAGDLPPKEDVFSLLSAGRTSSDPWLEFKIPKDTHEILVTVEDLVRHGGPGYGYRLLARKQPADFTLTVLNPYVNIPASGSVSVNVVVNRHGFREPIQLSIPELNSDFTVEGGHIPGEWKDDAYSISRRGLLTITAKPGAKPKQPIELTVWGEGKTEDGVVVRRRAQSLGMVIDVAGGTGIADGNGRDSQNPFVAPWLGIELATMVTKEEPGKIEVALPPVMRVVQGSGFGLKWNFKARNPDAKPPESIGVDMAAPPAAEISVRRAKNEQKEAKYADKGEFTVQTTTRTPPEKFDLMLFGVEENDMAGMTTPAITLEIVQGYKIMPPKEPVKLRPAGKAELAGVLFREPEFSQPVKVSVEYLPAHVTCGVADIAPQVAEYRISCEADREAKPGEYNISLAPSSVIIGYDKREMPYKIAPVEAKLIVSGEAVQASR
jgi:hypothetical protein